MTVCERCLPGLVMRGLLARVMECLLLAFLCAVLDLA